MAESLFVTVAVVGATELFKRLRDRDYLGSLTIIAAALIGVLAGVYNVDGLSVSSGLIVGLTASGVYSVASKVGGN